jgi:hypothetical protein
MGNIRCLWWRSEMVALVAFGKLTFFEYNAIKANSAHIEADSLR